MNDTTIDTAAPPRQEGVSREPFVFSGTTREYFGIWIVNVLLTIVTLGIYSAWAKVRRQRYFYGNTHLAGASFEYHARPLRILVGRIIVVVLLIAYNILLNIVGVFGFLVVLVALFAIPWLIARGLRFSARVTSYRNVRFDFTGGYWGAFKAYIVGGMVIYVTAGFLAPLASRWIWRYMMGNLCYGDRPIDCDPRLGKLYQQWWVPAFLLIGGLVVMVGAGVVIALVSGEGLSAMVQNLENEPAKAIMLAALIYIGMIPLLLLYLTAAMIYRAGTRNVAFDETVIDGRHALLSRIHRGRFAWIWISNLFATILTLGLARPWAAIRMAHYLSTVTWLDTTGSLDTYVSTIQNSGGATGSEFMEIEGFDFGF